MNEVPENQRLKYSILLYEPEYYNIKLFKFYPDSQLTKSFVSLINIMQQDLILSILGGEYHATQCTGQRFHTDATNSSR